MKKRYRLTVRYDGTGFSGSQIQPGKRTVQGTLKVELENILKQELHLLFASRTDTGVHADGNVCAFDAELPFPIEALPVIVNKRLKGELELREAREVPATFHPRFDALSRLYVYRVWNAGDMPVDRQRYCARVEVSLDLAAMHGFLERLPGWHSFASFSAGSLEPQAARCEMLSTRLEQSGAELRIWFCANRFLRSMVCRLTAALIAVGRGKFSADELALGLQSRMEFRFKPAPARGLTLKEIAYPPEFSEMDPPAGR